MNIFKVALFGHRDLYAHKEVEERLSSVLYDLLRAKTYVEIYIGRNGEFDVLAASVVKRVQKTLGKKTTP